jgi:plasmid stabilization system protein ParE
LIEFSDDSIADLTSIREWIAQDSAVRATDKISEIIATCQLLEARPGLGRVHRGLVQRFSKKPWLIVYAPTATGIKIYGVFDSRQNWAARLLSRVP